MLCEFSMITHKKKKKVAHFRLLFRHYQWSLLHTMTIDKEKRFEKWEELSSK